MRRSARSWTGLTETKLNKEKLSTISLPQKVGELKAADAHKYPTPARSLAEDAIRIGELDDRVGLVARRFYVQRSTVCAAPAYLDRHGQPQAIDDLERHALVVHGRDGFVFPWFHTRRRRPF